MSTHNICFHGEIEKISILLGLKMYLMWSCLTQQGKLMLFIVAH